MNAKKYAKHLSKEMQRNRTHPTLWARFHLKSGTMNYRGYHVVFYNDDCGQQVYTYLFGHCVSFGSYNLGYREDAQYLIDEHLDHIAETEKYEGRVADIEYRYNRAGKRRPHLCYRERLYEIEGAKNKAEIIEKGNNIFKDVIRIEKQVDEEYKRFANSTSAD